MLDVTLYVSQRPDRHYSALWRESMTETRFIGTQQACQSVLISQLIDYLLDAAQLRAWRVRVAETLGQVDWVGAAPIPVDKPFRVALHMRRNDDGMHAVRVIVGKQRQSHQGAHRARLFGMGLVTLATLLRPYVDEVSRQRVVGMIGKTRLQREGAPESDMATH